LPQLTSLVDHLEALVLFGDEGVERWSAEGKDKRRKGERTHDVNKVLLQAELKVALLVDCGERRRLLSSCIWRLKRVRGDEPLFVRSSPSCKTPNTKPTSSASGPSSVAVGGEK
jgi:hypothetical protein